MDNEFPEQCAISHSDNSKSSVNEIYMQNLVTQEGGDRVYDDNSMPMDPALG